METLQRALEPYRHWDPAGWVGLYRFLPVYAGLACVAFGAAMLFFGGGRLFRVVAGPLGAAIGVVWAGALAVRLGFAGLQQQVTLVAGGGLLALGLIYPPAVVFFAFGVPGGLLAGQLAGGSDWLLGFVPGFLVGGAVGVLVHRPVSAALSAAFGAWALVIGLLASTAPFLGAADFVADQPLLALGLAGVLAVAGGGYQIFVRLSPERREELRREKAMRQKAEAERKALEQRWASYSKTSKKKA